MKALANENRLEIYMAIVKANRRNYEAKDDAECFIYDIISKFKIGAPTISHHLKELENADLISTERKGRYLIAKVNEETLKGVRKILSL